MEQVKKPAKVWDATGILCVKSSDGSNSSNLGAVRFVAKANGYVYYKNSHA